ncbi:phage holin, LLH family [Lactobacillaceae bacterium 24-114]
MNEIINAIPEYVITAVISTAIFYAFKYAESLIHAKVLHAKTAQSKEMWGFIEQVSATAVNSLVNAPMTGSAKFSKATTIVQEALNQQGFKNVNVEAIDTAVQAAYEKSDLTHSDDPVFAAIAKAPNRANKIEAKG